MRRRRSSPMSSSIAASKSDTASPCRASSSRPSSSCLRSSRVLLRSRSIARCFAVAMSQAPGLSGTPDSGQRSSATMRASCARSSATPTSRTIRASPAMSRGDSILQIASIARWVSVAVTATDHTIINRPVQGLDVPPLLLRGHLRAEALLLFPEFRSELRTEVFRLEHLADLHLSAAAEWSAFEPLDRLRLRLHLPQPESGNQLLGLGERAVDHSTLCSIEAHPHALRARLEPRAREHHASFHQLLVELAHVGEDLLVRKRARLGVLVRFDDHHESHCLFSF